MCPYHAYDFNLRSGSTTHGGGNLKACVWPVKTENSHVFIEMDDEYELLSIRPVNPHFAANAPNPPSVNVSTCKQHDQPEPVTVTEWIYRIMTEPDPKAKVAATRTLVQQWRSGLVTKIGSTAPPDAPARQSTLQSVDPSQVTKRGKGGSERSRIAILHALANIELYAIDLALDVLARFPCRPFAPRLQSSSSLAFCSLQWQSHATVFRNRLSARC